MDNTYALRAMVTLLFISAIAIAIAIATPVPAFAEDVTTSGTVQIQDDGDFSVSFCASSDFGSVPVTSSTGGIATATVTLCYVDNQLDRDAFVVTLEASDFTHDEHGASVIIPAGNLRVSTTHSPMRISTAGCVLEPFGDDVGRIYASAGEGDLLWPVVASDSAETVTWGENSLARPVIVGGGLEGGGTASCDGVTYSITAEIGLELTVPPAQTPGDYTTTLVVNVPPNGAP